jgi:hypothetical protein
MPAKLITARKAVIRAAVVAMERHRLYASALGWIPTAEMQDAWDLLSRCCDALCEVDADARAVRERYRAGSRRPPGTQNTAKQTVTLDFS